MKSSLFLSIISFLLISSLNAKDLNPMLIIPWGQGPAKLGVQKDGEVFGPWLFDIDNQDRLWVPDFFQEEIVCFSAEGKELQRLSTPQIDQRLRFFQRLVDGRFLVISDQSARILGPDAQLLAEIQTGFDIPWFMAVEGTEAVVLVQADNGNYALVGSSDLTSMRSQSMSIQGRSVGAFKLPPWAWLASKFRDAQFLGLVSAETPASADLFQVRADGLVWVSESSNKERLLTVLRSNGSTSTLVCPPLGGSNGFNGRWVIPSKAAKALYWVELQDRGLAVFRQQQ